MNLHGTQELVGCAVAVRACESMDKVMPCAFLGLLEVPLSAGVGRGQRLGEEGSPPTSQLTGRFDVMGF